MSHCLCVCLFFFRHLNVLPFWLISESSDLLSPCVTGRADIPDFLCDVCGWEGKIRPNILPRLHPRCTNTHHWDFFKLISKLWSQGCFGRHRRPVVVVWKMFPEGFKGPGSSPFEAGVGVHISGSLSWKPGVGLLKSSLFHGNNYSCSCWLIWHTFGCPCEDTLRRHYF